MSNKLLTFSETHEEWTVDDYIASGDDGPWYNVVPIQKLFELQQRFDDYRVKRASCCNDLEAKLDAALKTLGMVDSVGMCEPYDRIVRECITKIKGEGEK